MRVFFVFFFAHDKEKVRGQGTHIAIKTIRNS